MSGYQREWAGNLGITEACWEIICRLQFGVTFWDMILKWMFEVGWRKSLLRKIIPDHDGLRYWEYHLPEHWITKDLRQEYWGRGLCWARAKEM